MAVSKRSAKCTECRWVFDIGFDSAFPICCATTGLTAKQREHEGLTISDFYDETNEPRILEDAGCPNFQQISGDEQVAGSAEYQMLKVEMDGWPPVEVRRRMTFRSSYKDWPPPTVRQQIAEYLANGIQP